MHLLFALMLAIIGQLTTTLMYFANAMSLGTTNVQPTEVLFASAIMTLGTFIAPSASGEGVRELVFVWLLGTKAGAAKAFLIGNLGFWIEKVPLSIPGGIILLLRRDPALHGIGRADLDRVRREAAESSALTRGRASS
jgi:Na+/melibiose symporter-like transporter